MMADHAGRIPAWRRLGLALEHEDQSRATVPELHTQHSETQHSVPLVAQKDAQQALQSSEVLAENGKSSSLGKRKLVQEPAEESGQTLKKSKTPRAKHATTGAAVPGAPITTTADPAEANRKAIQEAAPAETLTRPKGDLNYRKKQAKPNKRKRLDELEPQHKFAQAQPAASHDDSVPLDVRPTLLASTETDHRDPIPVRTPQRQSHANNISTKDASGSPDRRKSVAFTPDTKTTDGHTGQDLFKKWVNETNSSASGDLPPRDFKSQTPHNKEEKRRTELKRRKESPPHEPSALKSRATKQGEKSTSKASPNTTQPPSASVTTSIQKAKKKDPAVYIAYLTQYHTTRDHWKFNKAKQNDVVDNALNIFRIPQQHSEALLEYVSGLKGVGVIERLRERCNATLKEIDGQDAQAIKSMDEPKVRQAAQDEAFQERISKEAKRRKVEGDIDRLHDHPHGDGYIRRLRRKRAEELLSALGRTGPVLPASSQTSSINPSMKHLAPPLQRDSRKRKRRGEISSDESSSDSSSEEDSSSSESEAESGAENSDHSESSSDSDAGSSRSTETSDSNSNSGSDSEISRSSGERESESGGDADSDSD